MEVTYIYALIDPRTGEVRYVGKADDPDLRLAQHIAAARKGEATYKGRWIRKLLDLELKPSLEILEEVPIQDWEEADAAGSATTESKALAWLTLRTAGKVIPASAMPSKDVPTWSGQGSSGGISGGTSRTVVLRLSSGR